LASPLYGFHAFKKTKQKTQMKKQTGYLFMLLAVASVLASCGGNLGYKKTKSGLLYKIIGSGSKDAVVKEGDILKLNYLLKISSNDSVLNSSYGKMPAFAKVNANPGDTYNPMEVFPLLRNGDSVVIVQFVDSLVKRNPMSIPPFLKKGDKILTTFKVIRVFTSDSAAMADNQKEEEKERARQQVEMAAAAEKRKVEMAQDLKTEVPAMETLLKSKNINAQKTGRGTFVVITEPGTGEMADSGKYVSVRYAGKTLADGKQFESTMDSAAHPYTFMVGMGQAIPGWDDGLKLFKKGGKGTLYVPGALAYGKNPPPGSPFKPNEALVFDIVVEDVSDTPPQQRIAPVPQPAAKADAKKKK
jgi:FKBP-type peptidyl-prolyl cis-trans isomerase